MSDTHLQGLLDTNIKTLNSAASIIEELSREEYTKVYRPYFDSSLGKHLRHILDHYLCFQRDFDTELINYDLRQRDTLVETDKTHAVQVIQRLCQFFESLRSSNVAQPLSVLMCNDVDLPAGEITQSSLGRELQFLQGHSVHHYALIATILRFSGKTLNPNFGVAPSTIVYEESVKEIA